MRAQIAVAFLSGAVLALGAALLTTAGRGLPAAYAQTAGNNEVVAIMGNQAQGRGPVDTLFVLDSKSMRLAVYQCGNQGNLTLSAVRNITYDLKFEDYQAFGKQKPTVEEVRDKTREEDSSGKKPGKGK